MELWTEYIDVVIESSLKPKWKMEVLEMVQDQLTELFEQWELEEVQYKKIYDYAFEKAKTIL